MTLIMDKTSYTNFGHVTMIIRIQGIDFKFKSKTYQASAQFITY